MSERFGELFAHIAGSQNMYCAMALGEKAPDEADVEKNAKTKAAIVAALKASNTYCDKAYTQSEDKLKASVDVFGEQHSRYYTLIGERFARWRALRQHRHLHADEQNGAAFQPSARQVIRR